MLYRISPSCHELKIISIKNLAIDNYLYELYIMEIIVTMM